MTSPDMEPGHWVTGQWVIWVIFSVWVTGSPGHICDPVGDPNIFNFSNFRTNAQNAQLTF